MASGRCFLFLQGPSSPLFAKIADRLEVRGHRCLRINLNAGDQIFWRRKGGHAYRGRGGDAWRRYLKRFIEDNGVTDIVLLGEERPYHRIATEVAKRHGIEIAVVEMGYLRPDWLTIERNGMSSNSHFPIDPAVIIEAAANLPEPDWSRRYSHTFLAEALYDLAYNLPNVFFGFLYPFYRRHALFHPLAEYAGWLLRLAGGKRRAREAEQAIRELDASEKPFFIYPLQLQTDYQLRAHSPYEDQREAIADVLGSFAANASPETRLLVKVHPLDNGLIDWRGFITQLSRERGIETRVTYLDGGDMDTLLLSCRGVVTVNSTVGLSALQKGVAVKVLGAAIFDMPGLADQAPLDSFWTSPRPPEEPVRAAFFRLVAAAIQVRGNFYSTKGSDAGADAIASRLDARTLNTPDAFVEPKPRTRPQKRATSVRRR